MSEDQSQAINIFATDPILGKYLSHHPSRRSTLIFRAAIFYAIPALFAQLFTLNLDDQTASLFLPFLYALIAVPPVWYALHHWNREVVLYEKGFSYRRGSTMAYFKYAIIVKVRQNIETQRFLNFKRTVYDYELTSDIDEVVKINNLYSNTEKLTRSLDAFIARDRLPIIRQQLANGQDIVFGDALKLNQEGLLLEGRELFWHELKAYRVQGGKLILQTADNPEWAALPVIDLMNPVILLTLLKARVKNKDEKAVADEL